MKPSLLLVLIFISCSVFAQKKNASYDLLIGTYTGSSGSKGIYVYNFNSKTGEFSYKSEIDGVKNPSYLVISRNNRYVYSVNEVSPGTISAFGFNANTGELTSLNQVSSGGNGPAYVTVDDANKFVYAGNYGSGSLSAIPVNKDGSLNGEIQVIQQEGSSIDKNRQGKPHVHAAVLSPDNRYLFTPNLGTDKVNIYKVDASNPQPLTPADPPFVSVKPGSGPRHIIFHPVAKFVYLIQEMGGMITAFDYEDGKLHEKQTVTMLSSDFKGKVGAADIHISPDGKFLYGSNRDDANEIVIYSIDKNGILKYVNRQSTLGKTPRNFAIDPSGNFLLVANQNSNEIVIFRRNQKNGLLIPTGQKIQIGSPVCLKFVPIN